MHLKLIFRRLLWLNGMALVVFLLAVNSAQAFVEPPALAPSNNVAKPLNIGQNFGELGGQVIGKYDNLQLNMGSECTSSQPLIWDGTKVTCSEGGGGSGGLLSVLQANPDASSFAGTMKVGGNLVVGDADASWNLGILTTDIGKKIPILIATSSADSLGGGLPIILHGALLISEEENPTSLLAFASTRSSPFIIAYLAGSGNPNDDFGGNGIAYFTGAGANIMTGYGLVLQGKDGSEDVPNSNTTNLDGSTIGNAMNFYLGFETVAESIYSERNSSKNDAYGLNFMTNEKVRLTIANNGNVGIGMITSTPNNLLQVYDLINFDNTGANTMIGYQSGKIMTAGQATRNTALGNLALFSNTTGKDNTAVGASALVSNATGYDNVAIGKQALARSAYSVYNTAVGSGALASNDTGWSNTAVGFGALNENTTGGGNVANGVYSLYYNKTGNANVAIGYQSMDSNIAGNNNIAIGIAADVGAPDINNAIAIGANSVVGGSNMMVLGGVGEYAVKVGIGTSIPAATLDIVGNIKISGGNPGEGKVLVSDATGLATWRTIAGDGTIAYATSTLLDALVNGPDASTYTGGVLIGSNENTWMNLGGAFTAGWIHSIGAGNNSFVGNVGIGTASPAAKLDVVVNTEPIANLGGLATGIRSVAMIGGSDMGTRATGNYSLAAGAQAWATGDYSVALGGTDAGRVYSAGIGSFAAGRQASADGEGATALGGGYQTAANGAGAFAAGYYALADGTGAFAAGEEADANGDGAVAIGRSAYSSGYGAVALGGYSYRGDSHPPTSAIGDGSFAAGGYAKANGEGSVALGGSASLISANGDGSLAAGGQASANGNGAVALGGQIAAPTPNPTLGVSVFGNGSVGLGSAHVTGTASFAFNTNIVGDRSLGLGTSNSGTSIINATDSVLIGVGTLAADGVIALMPKNSFVGVNNVNPTAALDVIGKIKIADSSQGAGKVLTSDANGLATWQDPAALPASITYATPTLAQILTTGANASSYSGAIVVGNNNNASIDLNGPLKASWIHATSTSGVNTFAGDVQFNNDIYVSSGKVGIGVSNPTEIFEVADLIRFGSPSSHGGSTLIGLHAGGDSVNGYNTAVGGYALGLRTSGEFNTAIGFNAAVNITSGSENIAIGKASMPANATGQQNTVIGVLALLYSGNVNNNTAVGYNALLTTQGDGNVAIGYKAGNYEAGSNTLYIDNQDRLNLSASRANSLLYGTFADTAANQTLVVNAATTINGSLNVTGQIKTNGVAGLTQTIVVKGSNGSNCNLVITNGLITSTNCP